MGFFNSFANLPIALGKKHRFPLDSVTCTTADYLKFKVVFSRLYTSGTKWKIDASQFTRLTPLLKPAFANAKFENRLFFVPYRTVYRDWTHLVDGTQNEAGVVPQACSVINPIMFLYALVADKEINPADNLFAEGFANDAASKAEVLAEGYDLTVPCYDANNNLNFFFYKLKPAGKRIMDTLIALGYNFPFRYPLSHIKVNASASDFISGTFNIGDTQSSYGLSQSTLVLTMNSPYFPGIKALTDEEPTTLPLASALKIYYDYYLSGRGSRTKDTLYIETLISKLTDHDWNSQVWQLGSWSDTNYLCAIFKFFDLLFYDDDYFTTTSPTYMDTFGTVGNGYVIHDASQPDLTSNNKSAVVSGTSSSTTTPRVIRADMGTNQPSSLSQYILDSLMALTKYMRRNNIVGWKSLDRYMAHYGVKLDPAVLNRSLYLGKFVADVGIDAIFQQAETQNDVLGSYAGIGIGGGKGHFEFESKEFGQLIMISVCKPDVAYYQGMKREMMDRRRFEFFAGEFDNLGQQAVGRFEVCNSFPYNFDSLQDGIYTGSGLPTDPLAPFGFQNRYAHLKQSTNQDILSGDFRFYRAGASSYDYFHQFRSLSVGFNIHPSGVIDDNFRTTHDARQLDRIFVNQQDLYDHFVCFFSFKVEVYAPWQPLFDSLDFGDELHNGQPTRNVHVGGTKF